MQRYVEKTQLISRSLKIAGKENCRLDKKMSMWYIVRLLWKYGTMLVRGRCLSFGRRNIDKSVFVGRHVKILEKGRIRLGRKVKLHDRVYIDALSRAGVILGEGVVLGRGTRIECTGSVEHVGKGVVIGDRSTFSNDCFFGTAGGIRIGEDVIAGQYIRFHAEEHDHDDLDVLIREQGVTHQGVAIGNDCWIGSGAVFLDGARVGDGCVVAANAVVAGKFPDQVVIGGVPAKVIKRRGEKMHEDRIRDTEL